MNLLHLVSFFSVIVSSYLSPIDSENVVIQSYRLPNNSIPLRYDLWLKTDIDKENFEYSGQMKILVEILKPTDKITLHSNDTKVDKIDLLGVDGKITSENLAFEFNKKFNFLVVSLPQTLKKQEKFVLNIEFHGEHSDDKLGFYRGSYKDESDKQVWYAASQFQPIFARKAFPCFDEPALRAVINVQIQHSENLHAISSMPIISREKVEGSDYVISKFQDSPPIPTHVIAFVVSNFEFTSSNDTKIEQRFYAKPQSIKKGDAEYALSFVEPLLTKYQQLFGVDYPQSKLDYVAFTDLYNWGVESFGLVAGREDLFLPNARKLSLKKQIKGNLAHLIAHQYFGILVGYKWWDSAWIGTGLASMYEHYVPSLLNSENDFIDYRYEMFIKYSMKYEDEQMRNRTLTRYAETPEEIEDFLDYAPSKRARSILWMFHEALTAKTFTKGIKYFLTSMRFASASADDLHRELQKAFNEDFPGNGVDLAAAMKTWEDQSGYPVVKVEKSGDKFVLTQERHGGGEEIYTIPLGYRSSTHENATKIWMTEKTMEISDSSDWIILNDGWNGYFVVTYSDEILNALATKFLSQSDSISSLTKTEIMKEIEKFSG